MKMMKNVRHKPWDVNGQRGCVIVEWGILWVVYSNGYVVNCYI